jgi:hypothetical protein
MKTIEQALTQAGQVLNLEKKDGVKMLNITISSNTEPYSFYTVSLPKLFVEEFAKVVMENHKTLEI